MNFHTINDKIYIKEINDKVHKSGGLIMKNIAIIFAGGTGQRMGAEIPKQFLEISGKEIIVRTLEIFQDNPDVDEIYVVSIAEGIEHVNDLITRYKLDKVRRVVAGGVSGQDSIFIGLKEAKKDHEEAIVLIHDGVRPLVDSDVITNAIRMTEEYGSAITVTPVFETPLISEDGITVSAMPSRKKAYTAQAPQCFFLNTIYDAHIKERAINPTYEGIVDSCGLLFKNGIHCHLIEGNKDNIKVTTTENLVQLVANYNMRDYRKIIRIDEHKKTTEQPKELKLTPPNQGGKS
jgi:2-C-methyl-D-erythritol 4-phosphate cytidylyltransferase